MKLRDRLREALEPFVGEENSLENRRRIIKIVLNILPIVTSFDAEVMAVGLLTGVGPDEAKEQVENEKRTQGATRGGNSDPTGSDPSTRN